jgi:hypothetical protein
MVTGGIGDNVSETEEQESKYLWMGCFQRWKLFISKSYYTAGG